MPISDKNQQKPIKVSQPRYLFVDDDVHILDLLDDFFSHKAEVTRAGDGKDALDKILTQSFDAIISDVDMPILNGIDLFKCLYVKDPSITKRFLFCTGESTPELEAFCSTYDVRYIFKPISLISLQDKLSELCNDRGTEAAMFRG